MLSVCQEYDYVLDKKQRVMYNWVIHESMTMNSTRRDHHQEFLLGAATLVRGMAPGLSET